MFAHVSFKKCIVGTILVVIGAIKASLQYFDGCHHCLWYVCQHHHGDY